MLTRILSECGNSLPLSYSPRSPIRPIAGQALWCHNPQRHQISLPHRETSPLSPVSKDTRADNGDSSILVLLASRAWVQRSNVEPAAGWLAFQQAGRKGRQCPIGLVPCHGAAMKPNSSTSCKRARRRPSTGSSRTIMRRSITSSSACLATLRTPPTAPRKFS